LVLAEQDKDIQHPMIEKTYLGRVQEIKFSIELIRKNQESVHSSGASFDSNIDFSIRATKVLGHRFELINQKFSDSWL
jgi:hypothetical protein